MPARPVHLALRPHAPVAYPCAIEVDLWRTAGGALALRYVLRAETARLTIPPPRAPGPADGLWRHTCFEAFVAAAGARAYREFNFAPSGQWAAYAFRAERERDGEGQLAAAPALEVARDADRLALEARLAAAALPTAPAGTPLHIGLTAVVEDAHGALSYWALHHPGPQPDFHHRGGFVFELPSIPPSESCPHRP